MLKIGMICEAMKSIIPLGLAERLLATIDLFWLAIAGSQITRLARVTGQLEGPPEVSSKKRTSLLMTDTE
jgi:hypothetical protein